MRIRLSENVNLLIVSFAIAFVTWVFAKAGETEEARIMVPVNVTGVDSRMEVQVNPQVIPVQLRYPKDLENYITSGNFQFRVETADMRDNLSVGWKTKSQPLIAKDFVANIPEARRVSVLKIGDRSATVDVRMRWNSQAAVVSPDIAGSDKLPQGLQIVTPVKVTPREVWVIGDQDLLATIPRDEVTSKIKLSTERINVANRTQTSLETVGLKVPPGIEVLDLPTRQVEVNLEFQEVQTIREIRGIKLDFKAVAQDSVDLDYKEHNGTVTVFGPQTLLSTLTPSSFDVTLLRPAEEVPGTTKEVPLEVHFSNAVPDEVRGKLSIRSIDPKSLKIHYVAKAVAPVTGK